MNIFDEHGRLWCDNSTAYGCEPFAERGSHVSTDNHARLRGWKIFDGHALCPECAKPARKVRASGVVEQEGLPGIVFPVVPKSKASKKHIS
jgi:hypothetical protein